jgi:signal transduction histidine kinase
VTIRTRLNLAFSAAAVFLVICGIAAMFLIQHLNDILAQKDAALLQLDEVAHAMEALRASPSATVQHLARLSDLERDAKADDLKSQIRELAGMVKSGNDHSKILHGLEQVASFYRDDLRQAQAQLQKVHRRAVIAVWIAVADGVLLFVIIMYLVRYWLFNPLHRVIYACSAIVDGKTPPKIVVPGGGELAVVADALEKVAAQQARIREETGKNERLVAIGEACHHVAHSLRGLIHSVRSIAEYERQAPHGNADASAAFNHIIAATETMDRWTRDLNNAVKPLDPRPVRQSVEPVVHHVLNLFQPSLAGRRIEIEVTQSEQDLPPVMLDARLFERSLLAILYNALDASDDTGKIHLHLAPEPAGHVRLTVEDFGEGMDEKTLRQVFDEFFTTKPESSGLGLCLAKRIIERHEGSISIESQPGKGTRVHITLPAAPEQAAGQ